MKPTDYSGGCCRLRPRLTSVVALAALVTGLIACSAPGSTTPAATRSTPTTAAPSAATSVPAPAAECEAGTFLALAKAKFGPNVSAYSKVVCADGYAEEAFTPYSGGQAAPFFFRKISPGTWVLIEGGDTDLKAVCAEIPATNMRALGFACPTATSSASAALSPATDTDSSFWLTDQGMWRNHHLALDLTANGSGLNGRLSWNAGECNAASGTPMCSGNAKMTFVKVSGGMLGTFTSEAWYTTFDGGPAPAGFAQAGAPKPGETIAYTALVPHFATTNYGPNSPAIFGSSDTYMCQQDTPTPMSYDCGA